MERMRKDFVSEFSSTDDRNINPQVNNIDRSLCVLCVVKEKHLACMEPEVRLES